MKYIILFCALYFTNDALIAQTLSEKQTANARATGYAIVASRNPGISFSILMIPWDGVNTLEYNAQTQINAGWHAQAVVKGNYFYQPFDGSDFSVYSTVILSQAEFDSYKSAGTQWWIVCSTLAPFSNSISSKDGNVGIGNASPIHRLQISGGDIAFDAEQTERFIRINNSYGGAIRFRGNATTSSDRGLQFGRFDGNNIWSPLMTIETNNGNVGVGIEQPSEKLTINGNVKAKKVIVSQSGWPDYVFDSSYSLRSLASVNDFIKQHKRLPETPSAGEVEEKGISIGDNQALLLKKIEELTLYLIKQDAKMELLTRQVQGLKEENDKIKKIISKPTLNNR